MGRPAVAALALLLASRGCIAYDETTTMADERRLAESTSDVATPSTPAAVDTGGAVRRAGGIGSLFLALLALR